MRNYKTKKGVFQISRNHDDFQKCYLEIRAQEGRLHDDDIVRKLPFIDTNSIHYKEWKKRIKSSARIIKYLALQDKPLRILEVGCGNGWFSHTMTEINKAEVLGIDINMPELQQAARVFKSSNLFFAYVNYQKDALPRNMFDVIVLNSAIQYFPSLKEALEALFKLVALQGEIHILDSPIYRRDDLEAARARTKTYFDQRRMEDMQQYYHHHTWDDLEPFNPVLLYNPKSILVNVKNKIIGPDSPFAWIKMERKEII